MKIQISILSPWHYWYVGLDNSVFVARDWLSFSLWDACKPLSTSDRIICDDNQKYLRILPHASSKTELPTPQLITTGTNILIDPGKENLMKWYILWYFLIKKMSLSVNKHGKIFPHNNKGNWKCL